MPARCCRHSTKGSWSFNPWVRPRKPLGKTDYPLFGPIQTFPFLNSDPSLSLSWPLGCGCLQACSLGEEMPWVQRGLTSSWSCVFSQLPVKPKLSDKKGSQLFSAMSSGKMLFLVLLQFSEYPPCVRLLRSISQLLFPLVSAEGSLLRILLFTSIILFTSYKLNPGTDWISAHALDTMLSCFPHSRLPSRLSQGY